MNKKKINKKVSKKTTKTVKKKKTVKKVVKKVPKKKKVSKKKPVKKSVTKKTYVTLVLDKSGSMNNVRDEIISSFNDQIDVIRKESVDMQTNVSLITFDHRVNYVFFNEPVSTLQDLTRESYIPSGMTAMYDAIGSAIKRMETELQDINDPNVSILFVILTDGAENSSREYTSQDISEMISKLRATNGWTFSVIGANIDLEKLSNQLNIAKGNMVKFSADSAGVLRSANVVSSTYSNYFTTRRSMDANIRSSDFSEQKLYTGNDKVLDLTDDKVLDLTDDKS